MDTVAVFLFSLIFPLLCVLTVFSSAGQGLFVPTPLISIAYLAFLSGGFLFRKRRQMLFIAGVMCLLVCTVLYLSRVSQYHGALDRDSVCAVEGTLIRDSSYSSNGTLVLNLYLSGAQNSYGNRASARGMVRALCRSSAVLCAGTKVRLEGKFSADLFVCNSADGLAVTGKGFLNFVRENLILLVRKRLSGCSMGEMLILGRTENSENLMKLASGCGCVHVLALSGMHLNIIGGGVYRAVKKLSGRNTVSRIASVLAAFFFLFAAGPAPSLLRSFLFFALFFLPADERLVCAFVVQLALFPWSVFTQGAAFGYISVFALMFPGPWVKQSLKTVLPDAAAAVAGSSAAVLLFNAPLQILLTGGWHPVALAAGPLAALAVTFQMVVCLLCLAFPLPFLHSLSAQTAALIERIFIFCGNIAPASWPALAVLALCVVLPGLCSLPVGWQLRRKQIKS